MRFDSVVVGLVVMAAVFAPRRAHAEEDRTQPQTQPADERARFAGTFRFGGASAEEAARKAAIERSVSPFFFAIRGIARSRLSGGTKIEPWVQFAFGGGKIRMKVPSSPEAASPEQGTAADYVSGDDHVRLTQRLVGTKLTQMFVAGEGRRVNEWTLTPDGSALVLKVTISSSKMSVPCVYSLTYKRSP